MFVAFDSHDDGGTPGPCGGCSATSRSPVQREAPHFPASTDRDLAVLFGGETGDETDKFSRCRWHPGPSGAPVLDDCARWFTGHIVERTETGDHVGFLLEPVDGETAPWSGQLGFRDAMDIPPGHDA